MIVEPTSSRDHGALGHRDVFFLNIPATIVSFRPFARVVSIGGVLLSPPHGGWSRLSHRTGTIINQGGGAPGTSDDANGHCTGVDAGTIEYLRRHGLQCRRA
jgi:hypothetical protein